LNIIGTCHPISYISWSTSLRLLATSVAHSEQGTSNAHFLAHFTGESPDDRVLRFSTVRLLPDKLLGSAGLAAFCCAAAGAGLLAAFFGATGAFLAAAGAAFLGSGFFLAIALVFIAGAATTLALTRGAFLGAAAFTGETSLATGFFSIDFFFKSTFGGVSLTEDSGFSGDLLRERRV